MFARWLPVVAALCFLAPGEAHAQNPKLTLKLSEVTCQEALEALSKAAGTMVQLYEPTLPPNFPRRPPNPVLAERASFNWEGVTFANALRALCARYHLRPNRRGTSFQLYPSGAAPAKAPEKWVGLAERDGHRFFARSVSVSEHSTRSLQFTADGPQFGGGSGYLSLNLGALLGDLDASTLAGFENVTAVDDLGNRIEWNARNGSYYSSSSGFGAYPDEWAHSLSFKAPHPKAGKIAFLEGDLMVYRKVERQRFEVPLPLAERVVRKQFGDTVVLFSEFNQAGGDEMEEFGIPDLAQAGRNDGPGLRIRIAAPNTQGSWRQPDVPVLYGKTGKAYHANTRSNSGGGRGNWRLWDCKYQFTGMTEEPSHLVWETVARSEPVKLFRIRLTDIPLPAPAEAAAKAAQGAPVERKPVNLPEPPLPEHPFAARGGGTLLCKVERGGKLVAGGTLSLGLAPIVGGKAGAIRWTDIPVDSKGTATLRLVKPGTYRMYRKFRAANATGPARSSGWQNTITTVTVKAGQETTALPLRPAPAGSKK